MYQLRGVRTYAIGDVYRRVDLLAQLFAGINDDTVAYPAARISRRGPTVDPGRLPPHAESSRKIFVHGRSGYTVTAASRRSVRPPNAM